MGETSRTTAQCQASLSYPSPCSTPAAHTPQARATARPAWLGMVPVGRCAWGERLASSTHRWFRSTSAFLHSRFARRRPIPVMAVKANMACESPHVITIAEAHKSTKQVHSMQGQGLAEEGVSGGEGGSGGPRPNWQLQLQQPTTHLALAINVGVPHTQDVLEAGWRNEVSLRPMKQTQAGSTQHMRRRTGKGSMGAGGKRRPAPSKVAHKTPRLHTTSTLVSLPANGPNHACTMESQGTG